MQYEKFLQNYLYNNIPITSALGITVATANTEQVTLKTPLEPNLNHKNTVFGGSLHSVATLACWCLVFTNLREQGYKAEIVISASNIKYLTPVTYDFTTSCKSVSFDTFYKILDKKKKARIKLTSEIKQGNYPAVNYSGDFVAIL